MPKGKWWTAKTYKGPAKFTRAQSKNRNSPKFDTPKVYTKLFQNFSKRKVSKQQPFFDPATPANLTDSEITEPVQPILDNSRDSEYSLKGAQSLPLPEGDTSLNSENSIIDEHNSQLNSTSGFKIAENETELNTEQLLYPNEEILPIERSKSLEEIFEKK